MANILSNQIDSTQTLNTDVNDNRSSIDSVEHIYYNRELLKYHCPKNTHLYDYKQMCRYLNHDHISINREISNHTHSDYMYLNDKNNIR